MGWGYNHRLNRTGALIEQVPCRASAATGPTTCRARITAVAASGSGSDDAALETHFALVAARGVRAVSATREIVVQGLEGDAVTVRAEVPIPADAQWLDLPRRVGLLSGFDLASLGSADKLQLLSIRVEAPRVEIDGDRALVVAPVVVEAQLGCTSMECPPKNRVDTSVLVGVTALGGPESALALTDIDLGVSYAWDKKSELPSSAARVAVPELPPDRGTSVLAVRGFSVETSDEIHVSDLGLTVSEAELEGERPTARLLIRNWRRGMRSERPPMSWFAYRKPGRASWRVDLVRVEFAQATVAHRLWKTGIAWKAEGKNALAPEAERSRMIYFEVKP